MVRYSWLSVIAVGLLAFTFGRPSEAVVIDFGIGIPGSFPYFEDGFMVLNVTGSGSVNFGGCGPPCANNGTTNLFDGQGLAVDVRGLTVAPFQLVSFDAGELFQGFPSSWSQDVVVTGSFVGGGSVTQVFRLDFIHDGPGPNADMESFTLSPAFTNLSVVRFQTSSPGKGFTLDNIVVSTVPEPATLLLAGSGALGAGARWWRRRARRGSGWCWPVAW